MRVVSFIGDSYRDRFPQRWPEVVPWVNWPKPLVPEVPDPADEYHVIKIPKTPGPAGPPGEQGPAGEGPDPKRLEELEKEVRELRELLLKAKKFDEETGQPECEMDEKVAFIKNLADMLGVDMSEVFPND